MRRIFFFITFLVLVVMFVPWLGDTLFNTKGEPREAVVAVSMINSGNYILPESCGDDIPYKPPFLAWLIVAASWLTGGVTEFSSRLPSAVATILMAMGGYCFIRKYSRDFNDIIAMGSTIVTVTAFEVFRAATACRVDMVLTACIVGALYVIYNHSFNKKKPAVSWTAILLMSCAVLTKGPIGMILPCLVMWVFYRIRGERLWRSTWTLAVMGVLSLIIPAAWYWAAALQGGERFIALAMEENFGRFTGTMSYDSHVNPFYYNFITLIAGMAPYTLLAFFSIFAIKKWRGSSRGWWERFRDMDPLKLFSLVTIVVIVVFYCIPKSKRSVYLLPVYPFLAYFVTLLIMWLVKRRSLAVNVYSLIIGVLAWLVPTVLLAVHFMDVDSLLVGQKESNAAFVLGLHDAPLTWVSWIFIVVAYVAGGVVFTVACRGGKGWLISSALAATVAIYLNLSATAFPAILNVKSDITLAQEINRLQPAGNVYGYINVDMLRFYTAGFYTGDRIVPIEKMKKTPASGESVYLLVGEKDLGEFNKEYGTRVSLTPVYTAPRKSCDTKQVTTIYRMTYK